MATYSFRYIQGQSGPYGFVTEVSDERAGEAIKTFLNQKDGTLILGTIVAMVVPPRVVKDPEWAVCARIA